MNKDCFKGKTFIVNIPPPLPKKRINKLIYHKRRFKCYESNLEKCNMKAITYLWSEYDVTAVKFKIKLKPVEI